ncbi:MAG: hypothetical protein BMS9Abin11_0220 [Gammaproteobacteria bacterium]|nr:MAG: hypothetical protein BMS9Abin11_0220 [Gammaproteobacteria bacterium]
MRSVKRSILAMINAVGRIIPKKIQRFIVDAPGVLYILEKLSIGQVARVKTPEGIRIVINSLFHSNLVKSGDLSGYETNIREAITMYTRPGMVAYDIGANVGIFSFLFASLVGDTGSVYAFEPEPNNWICLEKSLEENKGINITLDKRAIGNHQGQESFDRRGGAFSGRLVGDNETYSKTDNVLLVDTVSIDFLTKQCNYLVPDILKIDVEGNEGLVLEGMKNILQHKGPIIICELHTHLGETVDKVKETLLEFDYSTYLIKGNNEGKINIQAISDITDAHHIVAIKNEN